MSGDDEHFSIRFESLGDQAVRATAKIEVGDFSENFPVDLRYWSAADYANSWRRALEVLAGSQTSTSCLVSSITDPSDSNFFSCWPMYRVGENVFVQNAVVFFDELDAPFDPQAPWRSVLPRDVENENGNRISEWQTTMRAVGNFLAQLDDRSS
jgi:hypothetical protein